MTTTQKRALTIAFVIAIIFGYFFLRSYFVVIALSAILAFVYNPSYRWIMRRTNNKVGLSITLTMLFMIISIIIPVFLILALTVNQAFQFVDAIKAANVNSDSLTTTVNNLLDSINRTASSLPGLTVPTLSIESITGWLQEHISSIASSAVSYLVSLVGSASSLITKSIIFIFIFISFLKNRDKLLHILSSINPLGNQATQLYISKISAMTKAMVKGQFIIAFLQGLTDAALLWLVGIDFFFFWLVILTFLSIIPLGGGIIVLPIGVVMLLTGHVWQGLVLIIGHLFIVTNIDNVLRPRLVPKTARLDSALTILSVFAGIAMFGFLGIVIGPVIMIIIVTTIDVYMKFVLSKDKNIELSELFDKK